MIGGVAVTVVRPTPAGRDRLGNPAYGEPVREVVPDVLVQPGPTSELDASRPEGVTVAYTLHFPKAYEASLEGCAVELPAPWASEGCYRVVGDPRPYMAGNCPTRWNRPVEVEAAHG